MVFVSGKSYFRIFLVLLIAISLIASSITGFVRLPQSFYYGALFLFGGVMVFIGRKWRIGLVPVFWLLFFSMISIIANNPPSYFRAWQRLFAFSISTIFVTPLFVCKKANEIRRQLFGEIMGICTILSISSFFCYFLGINYFTISNEVFAIEAGRFAGLFNQSMVLGPIAALSAVYSFSIFLSNKRHPYLMLVITVLCVGSVLFSASRSALGGCVLGLAIAYFRYYRGHISRGVIIGIVFIGVIALLYPLWDSWTDFVIAKQQNNLDSGSMFMSRESIWVARLSEIRSNPLTGVGFCCVDTGLTFVDSRTGIIEPGSSWLAVFSMTGVFGFLAFLYIFIKSFRHALFVAEIQESCILCGSLAFFGVHLFFEGYVLAVGSFIGLLFWLLIGCIAATPTLPHSS